MPRASKKGGGKTDSISQKVSTSVRTNPTTSWTLLNVVAMVIVIVIAGLVGWGVDLARQNKASKNTPAVAAVQAVTYDGQDGQNALDLLKQIATVQTQDSSMGVFVTSINGIENTNTQYWMFYVNGELASVAADQYQTKSSDKIEWRYQDIGNFGNIGE